MPTSTAKSPATKRGRPGYDQESVLSIAVSVFNKHGYDATSMGTLAENLGISKSAIYHHVPSKGDLLRLALDEALIPLEAIVEDERATIGTAEQRLEFFLRSTIQVLVKRQQYVTLLLRLRGNTEIERDALDRRRAVDRRVSDLVVEAQQEGSLRADIDPRTATRLLFGTINSLVEWFREGGPVSAEQVEEHAITMMFDGLHGGKR
ncbi:TetR/AcrR family transcriptional regulator [Paeniglutamicibacter cryotolerans]|uniref:AcrR family transcriptional regulator n=1 Tax=Paeniglutamicibacter cryotolerans TaxID=670079 RepID=A0A839QJC4_9MICC|nr:TetR/AcrR family transcriptional regulator [Paeniglutamicibacter cryotolerans]MBB2994136.1 AcrR family transcriptional regulator [Paeniglutamicibacter cryotolerans]